MALGRLPSRIVLSALRNQAGFPVGRVKPLSSYPTEASIRSSSRDEAMSEPCPTKRPYNGGAWCGKPSKRLKKKKKPNGDGSHEEILLVDVKNLQKAFTALKASETAESTSQQDGGETAAAETLPEQGTEIDVEVVDMSSTGEGLARYKGSQRLYVVPFAVPGDTVRVKVFRHLPQYTVTDFISVAKAADIRDDTRIQCPYFAKCSGCQFQMLDYPEQLRLKRRIVEKAYANYSQLPKELVPQVLDTVGSPLQYGYRTKLTPHFDGSPGFNRRGNKKPLQACPPIGFTPKGQKKVIDIEDCPIGTEAVRVGLRKERERMKLEFGKYERGATILLRESTTRVKDGEEVCGVHEDAVKVPGEGYTDFKTCLTDNKATSTEFIDNFIFTNPAGSFFQNNNSILSTFTTYIRENLLCPPAPGQNPIRNLIDAYSGSGLFTITQSSLFFSDSTNPGQAIGIDIAAQSIDYARRNAQLNGLTEAQCRFIAADAPQLFKNVAGLDPDETVVVLDPPRKGCDPSFLRQLLRFAPRRLVYVSCNVHTQSRDVGALVRGVVGGDSEDEKAGDGKEACGEKEHGEKSVLHDDPGAKQQARYEIESIRGFDFFPQTGHVEGVAVLNRVNG